MDSEAIVLLGLALELTRRYDSMKMESPEIFFSFNFLGKRSSYRLCSKNRRGRKYHRNQRGRRIRRVLGLPRRPGRIFQATEEARKAASTAAVRVLDGDGKLCRGRTSRRFAPERLESSECDVARCMEHRLRLDWTREL